MFFSKFYIFSKFQIFSSEYEILFICTRFILNVFWEIIKNFQIFQIFQFFTQIIPKTTKLILTPLNFGYFLQLFFSNAKYPHFLLMQSYNHKIHRQYLSQTWKYFDTSNASTYLPGFSFHFFQCILQTRFFFRNGVKIFKENRWAHEYAFPFLLLYCI